MKLIKVSLRNPYHIITCKNRPELLSLLIKRLNLGDSAYAITNSYLKNKYGNFLLKALRKPCQDVRLKVVPDSEQSKSLTTAYSLIKDIASSQEGKRTFIVAFGGGVIGDLAGFVASIYKRGIPYIQVPTTLLAQVDSSIGGKTAVDLVEGKNLVGAFYQPRMVFSDVAFLKSLPLRQIRSGLAEVIKYALIKDMRLFCYLELNYKRILALEPAALEFIVSRCSQIKARIVSLDEKEERLIRTILNFGHTIGHAIEAAGSFRRYSHGEAIAIGMCAACDLSKKLKLLNEKEAARIEKLIKATGLPTAIRGVSLKSIVKAHFYDKKFIGGKNRFVLLKSIGKTVLVDNVPLEAVRKVLINRGATA